jgi:uncharacterized protein (TIGR03435 family)
VNPENVSGPDWIPPGRQQWYTLMATMPPDTTEQEFELMLRRFIIEQFRITFHHEPKNFPAYDLVVAQAGAKLARSADQTTDPNSSTVLIMSQMKVGPDVFLGLPPGHAMASRYDKGSYATFQDFTMPQLATFLGGLWPFREASELT